LKYFTFLILIFLSFYFKAQSDGGGLLEYNVNVLPENYGGKRQLKKLITSQLNYPKTCIKRKLEGKVVVEFIIDTSGNTHHFHVQSAVNPEFDAEALRLAKHILWEPAFKNGKPVSVFYSTEISFNLNNIKKKLKILKGLENLNEMSKDTSGLIYPKPEKPASPFYGVDSLLHFIATELVYPEFARVQNIEGTVQLEFVVETNGVISNLRVKSGIGGGCNEEAIAVFENTKWYPATHQGVLVRQKMEYPIRFQLNNKFHDNSAADQRKY
jgi:TonB family protein